MQVSEDISKNIAAMKFVLYGDAEHEPNPDTCGILANEVSFYLDSHKLDNGCICFASIKDIFGRFNSSLSCKSD